MRQILILVMTLAVGFALGQKWSFYVRTESIKDLGDLTQLSDKEILSKRSYLEQLDIPESKIIQALLACIGLRSSQPAASTTDSSVSSVSLVSSVSATNTEVVPTPSPTVDIAIEVDPSPSSKSEERSGRQSRERRPDRPSGGFAAEAPFCHQAKPGPLTLLPDPKWRAHFPDPEKGQRPNIRGWSGQGQFGWVSHAIGVRNFLNRKTCNKPEFWEIKSAERIQLEFFQAPLSKVFEGEVHFLNGQKPETIFHFHFNPKKSDSIWSYWFIAQVGRDGSDGVLENFVSQQSDQETPGVNLRANKCNQGISILRDYCPWFKNPKDAALYDFEYKDIWQAPTHDKQSAMIGNIYCRKRSDRTWVKVAWFDLYTRD